MERMTDADKRENLTAYVEEWRHDSADAEEGNAFGGLNWQAALLPIFADAGVVMDAFGKAYVLDSSLSAFVPVPAHVAAKELVHQVANASKSQVARYYGWVTMMIERE